MDIDFALQLKALEQRADDMLAYADTPEYDNEEFFELAKDALFLGSQAQNTYQIFQCLTFTFDMFKLYYHFSNLALALSCRGMIRLMSDLFYIHDLPPEQADKVARDAIKRAEARAKLEPALAEGTEDLSSPLPSKKSNSDLN